MTDYMQPSHRSKRETGIILPLASSGPTRMKKSKSIDIGKLCRQSCDVSLGGGARFKGATAKSEALGLKIALSARAKSSGSLALKRSSPRLRRSSLTGPRSELEWLRHASSSSGDLVGLSNMCDDPLAELDFYSAPLAAGAHNSSTASLPSDNTSPNNSNNTTNSSFIMKVIGDKRRWTVGRISVCMLVVFTATDFLLHGFGIHIRPTIGIVSVSEKEAQMLAHNRPAMELGAAAISSITDTLSPILPFTGGLDLRREDYWQNGLLGSIKSVIVQVRDAFSQSAPSQLSSSATPKRENNSSASTTTSKIVEIKHSFSISAPKPFVATDKIAQLSLGDMATVNKYALERTRPSFNRYKFTKQLEPHMKEVIQAIEKATMSSRGANVSPARTSDVTYGGDMDALYFCAATRLLAEWRVIRQVPEGYKGYAVGMNLGHKDVVQNLAKIEKSIHALIDERAAAGAAILRAPTLFDLLQNEIDTGVQDIKKLPYLQERSAGMGLLWVRRQLQYQNALFTKFLLVGEVYSTTNEALNAAYYEVYGKFHGWAVQKIFSYSFQAAPEIVEIFKIMNPRHLKEVQSAARSNLSSPLVEDETTTKSKQSLNIFQKIHQGWDKVASNTVGFFEDRFGKRSKTSEPSSALKADKASSASLYEEFVAKAMTENAISSMRTYLAATDPILKSLSHLFHDLNMNDPSKV